MPDSPAPQPAVYHLTACFRLFVPSTLPQGTHSSICWGLVWKTDAALGISDRRGFNSELEAVKPLSAPEWWVVVAAAKPGKLLAAF